MATKDCFVIMPFSKSKSHTKAEWTERYEKLFKPAWEEFDISCHRTKVPRGSITKDIIESLFSAYIVFADLTDSNPNVMYELGVRHSFRKPSIMVKEEGSTIPFDLKDYHVIDYKYTPKGLEDLKDHIKSFIEDVEQFPNKADNPVWDFLRTGGFVADYLRRMEDIQKLEALREELTDNMAKCDEFLKDAKSKAAAEQAGLAVLVSSTKGDALAHLRVTRYVSFLSEDWKVLNSIDWYYSLCHLLTTNLRGGLPVDDAVVSTSIEGAREAMRKASGIVGKRIDELQPR